MGLFNGLFGKKQPAPVQQPTTGLIDDIRASTRWVILALLSSGYKADLTVESMREIDRFFDEQFLRLWINNEHEFSYKGFDSKEDEQRFDYAVRFVYKKLCELLGDDYEIINDIGYGMPEQDNEQVYLQN